MNNFDHRISDYSPLNRQKEIIPSNYVVFLISSNINLCIQ